MNKKTEQLFQGFRGRLLASAIAGAMVIGGLGAFAMTQPGNSKPQQQHAPQKPQPALLAAAPHPSTPRMIENGAPFSFADLVERVSPAVVTITVEEQAKQQAGLDPDKDLKFRYTGSHAATVKAVESGTVDAGACDETVFRQMTRDGKADAGKLRVFQVTAPFVDYVWAARPDLDPATQKAVVKAFTDLKPGTDDQILEILRGKSFVAADDAEYDAIRTTAKELSLF